MDLAPSHLRRAAARTATAANGDRFDQRNVRQSAGRAELADGRPTVVANERTATRINSATAVAAGSVAGWSRAGIALGRGLGPDPWRRTTRARQRVLAGGRGLLGGSVLGGSVV